MGKLLPFPISPEARRQLHESIAEISAPRRSYYLLVVLSTTIASFGLLANSTAVVIGAMLVAPLMGPIFGVALGVCESNRRLFGLSLSAEALGMALAIGIGWGIGAVPLRPEFGAEILGRTQPTLYDVIIALASGLAGAYTFVNPRINPALPGVAIATALVPPLATCGLCLSAREWELGWGAFLLFFANFLAIELAAALVFTVAGLADGEGGVRALRVVVRRFWSSLLLLCGVAVFMTHTLLVSIERQRLNGKVEEALTREMSITTGAHLSAVHLHEGAGELGIVADVLTPQPFEPRQVAAIEAAVERQIARKAHLIIRSLLSKDADRSGPVYLPYPERRQRARDASDLRILQDSSATLRAELVHIPGAQLVDMQREDGVEQEPLTLTAVVRTPTTLTPDQVRGIQGALTTKLGQEVRLLVRSVLTRDADAERYLYEATPQAPQLSPEASRLRERLEAALGRQLAVQIPGASLSELRIDRDGDRLALLAVARTPRNFEPAQVARVRDALRKYVDPRVGLVVRSVVGTDTAADGYRTPDAHLPPSDTPR